MTPHLNKPFLTMLCVLCTALPALSQPITFIEAFETDPMAPASWNPDNWDITVHLRSRDHYQEIHAMEADHGADCAGPPATHTITAYSETVYNCKNHMMTAINGPGYGAIYLTPNHMVDFSEGEAVVRFNMSTFRKSGRDWIDVWISPFDDHVQLPLDDWLPDLQGEPRRGVHIRMDLQQTNSTFKAGIIQNHDTQDLSTTPEGWQGYESFLTPDQRQRDLFELRISQTHIAFGMPEYDFWWYDTDIDELDFDTGIVQLGHHSYNPTKDCAVEGACSPNTWHWDNVTISPARPFTLIKATTRATDASINNGRIAFKTPAPPDAYLRFSAIGTALEVSFDEGTSWESVQRQTQELNDEGHFSSYFSPIPEGTSSIVLRGQDWWGGPWHARDFSIWSKSDGSTSVSNESPPEIPTQPALLEAAYPNPFSHQTQFTLTIGQQQNVSIQVFDVLGRRVESIYTGTLTNDRPHSFIFDASTLPPGTYTIQAKGEQFNQTQQVVVY